MDSDLRLSPTLSAIELDVGDAIIVHMLDGGTRRVVLKNAGAHVVMRGKLPYADREGVIRYRIMCEMEIDGHTVHLVRNIPSQTNFFMVNLRQPVAPIRRAFRERKVAVGRDFPPMLDHLRVSVGTEAEIGRFMNAFEDILRSPVMSSRGG